MHDLTTAIVNKRDNNGVGIKFCSTIVVRSKIVLETEIANFEQNRVGLVALGHFAKGCYGNQLGRIGIEVHGLGTITVPSHQVVGGGIVTLERGIQTGFPRSVTHNRGLVPTRSVRVFGIGETKVVSAQWNGRNEIRLSKLWFTLLPLCLCITYPISWR